MEEEKKHILIVDDVSANIKIAADVLKDEYRLSMAKSGKQAIEFLEKAKPDLILLDVKMPEMDGYDTLQIIKANPDTASIPVVFLTVDDRREAEIQGLKLGAMDFILKPFEPDVMLSRINKILQIEDLRKDLTISARKDYLTEVWNRRYIEDYVERYLDEGDDREAAFLLLDLDNFKMSNDTYGHMAGDVILSEFAKIMESIIGPRDAVARLGGDEFVIFLKGKYQVDEVKKICEEVLEKVRTKLPKCVDPKCRLSTSIGVAMCPVDGKDYNSLYSKADKALYYVKENGKDNYHFFREKEFDVPTPEQSDAMADMHKLEKMISEQSGLVGAYKVEYEAFKHIYQFVSRGLDRSGQSVKLILLTINAINGYKIAPEELDGIMSDLERTIVVSLRLGDVTTRYSSFQYVVMLPGLEEDDARKVAMRICDTFNEIKDKDNIIVQYVIGNVEAKKRE